MSINFFINSCQEPPRSNDLFGLCDDQDGTIAYTNLDEPTKWIATVKNKRNLSVVFTAIDKCVINDDEEPERGRCDCMLTTNEHLYFVELKDEAKSWKTKAIDQLESTIQFFRANHDISIYKHKKAFACNKQHPHFQETDNEFNKKFFSTYGFRIDVQAEIIVL